MFPGSSNNQPVYKKKLDLLLINQSLQSKTNNLDKKKRLIKL